MRRLSFLLILLALIGFAASAFMTQMHFKLVSKGFEEKSFCNLSDFVDCDTALASSYSQIQGIPTSEFGLLYYLFFALAIIGATLSAKHREKIFAFLAVGAFGAVIYSLLLAYFSFIHLRVLCLFCLTTYLVNIALFCLVPRMLQIKFLKIPSYLLKSFPLLMGPLLLFLLWNFVGLYFLKGITPKQEARLKIPDKIYLQQFYAQPVRTMTIENFPYWGPEKAPLTILEFSDFQCPFCRRAAFTLKPYLKEFRNQIRMVFINFPLDNACNPAIPHSFHPTACLAAKGSLCSKAQGKFWEYHDQVFENQKRLSRNTLLEIAGQIGLDPGEFSRCLASEEVEKQLAEEVKGGQVMDVRGTPSLFINGRSFPHWTDPEKLRLVIRSELKKKN